MKKTRHLAESLGALLLPLVAVVAALWFFTALNNLETGQSDEGRRQLEDALRRSAVACYAAEGIYPPDLDYLEDRYGVQIDHARYTVDYDVFGSNLMPDITVLENEP